AGFTGLDRISKNWKNGSKRSKRISRPKAANKSRSCHLAWRPMQKAILEYYLLATLSFTLTGVVHAQGPAPSPLISVPSPPPATAPAIAPQPSAAPELTKADFETFLDALIPSQLQNRNIAGAVVSVVKAGQVIFKKV